MIVLDASAALELLLGLPGAERVREELDAAHWQIAAPQLLTLEVLQVLRRRLARGTSDGGSVDRARALLGELNVRYFDHQVLADRVWQLRDNLTAYDACYVALAEALDGVLVTADARLAAAPGHVARVTVID